MGPLRQMRLEAVPANSLSYKYMAKTWRHCSPRAALPCISHNNMKQFKFVVHIVCLFPYHSSLQPQHPQSTPRSSDPFPRYLYCEQRQITAFVLANMRLTASLLLALWASVMYVSHAFPLPSADLADSRQVVQGANGTLLDVGSSGHNVARATSRPFYAIAHRVLNIEGVDAAIRDGANALEIDFTAWRKGSGAPNWWADHDGTPTSWEAKAEDILAHIAKRHGEGRNILWVWFDIKNPNKCDARDPKEYRCSIQYLQDLARQYLRPRGIRVLYGLATDSDVKKGAYASLIERGLDPVEAMGIEGDYEEVDRLFNRYGSTTPIRQRVMTRGLFNWDLTISKILRQVKLASQSGKFGRSIAWTMVNMDSNRDNIRKLITDSKGDGLIYGGILSYQDGPLSKAPLAHIKKVVEELPEVHMAQVSNGDWPW